MIPLKFNIINQKIGIFKKSVLVNNMLHIGSKPNPPAPFPAREGGVNSRLSLQERGRGRGLLQISNMYLTLTELENL